jgi:hypothetical protein
MKLTFQRWWHRAIDGELAAKKRSIIKPSTAPRPPGRRGINTKRLEIIKTSAITIKETSHPKGRKIDVNP